MYTAGTMPDMRWLCGMRSSVRTAGKHMPSTQIGSSPYSGRLMRRAAIPVPSSRKAAITGVNTGLPGRLKSGLGSPRMNRPPRFWSRLEAMVRSQLAHPPPLSKTSTWLARS